MPRHIDILLERLRHYDELTLLELLDISSEEIVTRFKDLIMQRKDYLCAEIELFPGDELDFETEDWDEELDGFQIEYYKDEEQE